jgi:transmembrane sensor
MSRLAKHVRPRLDDARLARQWSVISSQQEPPKQRSWMPVLAAGFALAALALFFFRPKPQPIVQQNGITAIESIAGRTTMTLADGSSITTSADAKLTLVEATSANMRVALSSGAADFDVRHDPSRTFVVQAGELTIIDTGTRFHVEYAHDGVAVSVSQGSVRLERPAASPANLVAGDSWSSSPAPIVPHDTPPIVVTAQPATDAAAAPPPPHDDLLDRFEALAATDPGGAFDLLGESGWSSALARATPKQLFAMGDVARLSGHPRQAALAFDALRTKHRDDARAGLAAMELGRLKQDTLHDPSGADEAYRDAVVLSPDASFREDAEARRVAALESLGSGTACAEARDAYLARYPSGVHAKAVAKRCGGK